MSLIKEAFDILAKEQKLSLKDYERFIKIGDELESQSDLDEYSQLAEGIEIRLPEIAEQEGSYDWVVD
jgi:predicted nucleotidyltransferase|tara:strand:+ start:1637 stop:1840 length:204 start_codon:yes stop_codon:yes gene_type:complete